MKISIVIPALNEEAGIGQVIEQIPTAALRAAGHETEIIIVDNGSSDRTAQIACQRGATVVTENRRGYGQAYKAGFKRASGDIIVTGDADMTYPFDTTEELVNFLLENDLDFLNTNRLEKLNPGLSARIHALGTWVLTRLMQIFFKCPFRDSQSGMWIFRRDILKSIKPEANGMPFSQEIKLEAFTRGFRCDEIPIEYRPRVGESKLNTLSDGLGAMTQLVQKCYQLRRQRSQRKKDLAKP